MFEFVPPEIREMAAASVPWRTELGVYRSDLADRLPDGLEMPRALGVFDLDDLSGAVWLETVPDRERPWDADRFTRAAYLLGRLAGSERVAPLAQIDDHQWTVLDYLHGRFDHQVVPMLHDDDLWAHPLLAGAFGDGLRDRMRDALRHVPGWVDELASAPQLPGHGDACPNNLMAAEHPDAFVLIDFGFWKPLPLGFDLGQLLLGDVQIGCRTAADLAAVDGRIVPAYLGGLAAEGRAADVADVTRLHLLQMAVFSGLSSMPFEHLGAPSSPALTELAAARAAITVYCLDRIGETAP
ncbi:MAG: phosphotransferase, partial [Ilumatobacteraceae bacterium]